MKKVLDHGHVQLVDSMPSVSLDTVDPDWGPGDQRIVDAARVSVDGPKARVRGQDQKLLHYLMVNKHTSPLEKVRFEFDCKMPIFVARQWMRHRTGSFNEQSARYGEVRPEFYVPELSRMQAQAKSNKQASGDLLAPGDAVAARELILSVSGDAFSAYRGLLGSGLSRELARSVLPVNTYTRFWWTVDLHNFLHFCNLRIHPHAQHEIRVYAEALLEEARLVAPFAVSLWEESRK